MSHSANVDIYLKRDLAASAAAHTACLAAAFSTVEFCQEHEFPTLLKECYGTRTRITG